MKIKESLAAALDQAGKKQKEIGDCMGVTQAAVSRYMNRDGITAQNMIKFLEAAGYEVYAVPAGSEVHPDSIRIEPNE